jgi:6-phosphogluconolactonase (cycloisomerase 2 family)
LVDPTGRWLLVAWRTSNEVAVYPLNPETGQVIGPRQATLPVVKPMCILLWDSTL